VTSTSTRWGLALALLMMVATTSVVSAGCAARARPALVDAQMAMRVRTALLNDPVVGGEDLRVDVRQGVVYLSGRISSEERRARIVALAQTTPGVTDVQMAVEVRPDVAPVGRPLTLRPPDERRAQRHVVGLGAAVRLTGSTSRRLGDALEVTPLFSLGPGEGWGPAIGFGWSSRTLVEGIGGRSPLARLRLRPVLAGLAYSKPVGRASASLSLVGGYAFNALHIDEAQAGPLRAIAVSNTLVVRPSASLKVDIRDRVGLQLSAGYLRARPRVTFASDTLLRREPVNADALTFSVGAVYWIF
jgi:hypothetical protein